MYLVVDIRGNDLEPKINSSKINYFLFYFLLFLCNIIFLNLFIGLIINNYRTIKEEIDNFKTLNE